MFNVNNVILTGKLAKDPETRFLISGACLCKLRLAVVDEWIGKDGNKGQSTLHINADVWGNTAERCSETLREGSEVCVEGSLKLENYETKDGRKIHEIKVNARSVRYEIGQAAAPPRQDPARFPADDRGPSQPRMQETEEATAGGNELPF